jgi:hypothetical protein
MVVIKTGRVPKSAEVLCGWEFNMLCARYTEVKITKKIGTEPGLTHFLYSVEFFILPPKVMHLAVGHGGDVEDHNSG